MYSIIVQTYHSSVYMQADRGWGRGGHHEAIPGCRCRDKYAEAHNQNTHGYTSPWLRLRVHSCQSVGVVDVGQMHCDGAAADQWRAELM